MPLKNLFITLVVFFILAASSVFAQKWDNFGLDAGIYVDTDSISYFGSSMSFSYKFTNEFILKKLSALNEDNPELSVCYMRASVSCPSGKKLSSDLYCYDSSGNVVIDKQNLTYTNNTQDDPAICKNLKKMKKFRKFNLI